MTIKLESYFDLWSMIEMIVILANICNHHSAWLCLMQNPHGCTLHNYSLHPMDAIIIHHFTPWMRMDSGTILRAPALTIVNVITTLIIGWRLLQFQAFDPFNLRRVTPVCWTVNLGGNIKQKSLQYHFLICLWLQPPQEQVSQESYVASGVLVNCRLILLILIGIFVICVS